MQISSATSANGKGFDSPICTPPISMMFGTNGLGKFKLKCVFTSIKLDLLIALSILDPSSPRPLICKRAVEVAKELLNIFLDFVAPTVLQSDNGREFTANIIKELGSLWPNLVLENGRPRHPQSQGSV
nr:unnamed protein product [Callosobruchus chinensis]